MGNVAATDCTACGMISKARKPFSNIRARGIVSTCILAIILAVVSALSSDAQETGRAAAILESGSSEQKRDTLMQLRLQADEVSSRLAVKALSDPDELVRATAIGAIGKLPASEVSALLVPLMNDKAEFIRREAAFALGEARSVEAVAELSNVVRRDRAPIVRAAAAAALGKIGSESGLVALTTVFKKRPGSGNEYLRRVAAHSIGEIAERVRFGAGTPGLTQTTPTNFLPLKYKQPLANIYSKPPLPAFSEALRLLLKAAIDRRETADTRREIAFALGSIGDPSALGFLTANTSNSDIYLAEICREALLKIRSVK
ncbi:MAG: HEAT repeat domain-containing protein [Pyrinomonadaceae bacterium]|nr:HEAT repeat domain-containing protein [Pyrinomonadaceae bacterium]